MRQNLIFAALFSWVLSTFVIFSFQNDVFGDPPKKNCQDKLDDLTKEFDTKVRAATLMASLFEAREEMEIIKQALELSKTDPEIGKQVFDVIKKFMPEFPSQDNETYQSHLDALIDNTNKGIEYFDQVIPDPGEYLKDPFKISEYSKEELYRKHIQKKETYKERAIREQENYLAGNPSSIAFADSNGHDKNIYIMVLKFMDQDGKTQIFTLIHEMTHVKLKTKDYAQLPKGNLLITSIDMNVLHNPDAENEAVAVAATNIGVKACSTGEKIYNDEDLARIGQSCDISNVAFYYETLAQKLSDIIKNSGKLRKLEYTGKDSNDQCRDFMKKTIRSPLCPACQRIKNEAVAHLKSQKAKISDTAEYRSAQGDGTYRTGTLRLPPEMRREMETMFNDRIQNAEAWNACEHTRANNSATYEKIVSDFNKSIPRLIQESHKTVQEVSQKYQHLSPDAQLARAGEIQDEVFEEISKAAKVKHEIMRLMMRTNMVSWPPK